MLSECQQQKQRISDAIISFRFSNLSLATCRKSLAESGHENIHPSEYNSVSDVDRNSLICANDVHIARRCFGPEFSDAVSGSGRTAEPTGDDEANDGAVEIE